MKSTHRLTPHIGLGSFWIRAILVAMVFGASAVHAAQVQTILVNSEAYGRPMPVAVVLPDRYQTLPDQTFPVAYLLHGAHDDHTAWPEKTKGVTARMADLYQRILVCPTGGPFSWYTDSPDSPAETYIIQELIPFIDQAYRTEKANRWLTGLSMGGYGSLKLGLNHPDRFAAFVGQSPCIDPGRWKTNWELDKALGPAAERQSLVTTESLKRWANAKRPFGIIIGTDDFFYQECVEAQGLWASAGVDFFWQTLPGEHNWDFWTQSLPVVFEYFEKETILQNKEAKWRTVRGNLQNSFRRFTEDKVGRVAYLGGSITQNPGWQNRVSAWLQERFPETAFEFINAGIASTGSTPGAFRLENDVLSKGRIDLLFEEAAVNDLHNMRSPVEQIRAMEGIVRHAREANPLMDIVFLYFAEPRHTADYAQGRTPDIIANHEKVAHHYDITSLHLAQEVHDRMDQGQFNWERDFMNLHPSPFGQRLYYRAIRGLLESMFQESPSLSKVTPSPLPDPLDPQCYSRGKFAPLASAEALKGFQIKPDYHIDNGGGTRGGFTDTTLLIGETAGSSFELPFQGRAVGLFVAAGPDAGILEYRIDDGPVRELDTFTPWSAGLNIPWAYILDADLPAGDHRLFVELTNRKNPNSKGHALRIRNFLINESESQ